MTYVDESCLVYQHKDVNKIEQSLDKFFSNICDWFLDEKVSIHLRKDKTKGILFDTKQKLSEASSLDIR